MPNPHLFENTTLTVPFPLISNRVHHLPILPAPHQASTKGEKLQREIARMQQQAAARHQFVAGAADDETRAENERHARTVKEQKAEIERLQSRLDSDQKEHQEGEADRKKRLVRLADECDKTISDYDYQMMEKTKAYTRLREMYEAESATLRDIGAKAAALVAEREAFEKAVADEEARLAAIALQRFKAAVLIQKLMRGWLVRNRIKKEKAAAAAKAAKKAGGKKK